MPRINVKDKRKQQLIEANISSIAKRGISETTIAHVSQGAGMSRGIVNFYFTTKEAMMQESCQYMAEEYTGAWQRALEKLGENAAPADALNAMVDALFAGGICQSKKLSVWVAFWGHASSQNAYKKIISAHDQLLLDKLVQLAQAHGALAVAPETFAAELHALVRGAWLRFLLSAETPERKLLADQCHAYVARVLNGAALSHTPEKAPAKAVKEKAPKTVAPVLVEASNITEISSASAKKAAKKKPEEELDEQAALGDLFAVL